MKKIEKFTKLRLKSINDGILRVGSDFIRQGPCFAYLLKSNL